MPSVDARDDGFWTAVRDAALFHSGRPMLLVPGETANELGSSIVVAWKDGVEAVHAVVAARPLLAKAKRITLLYIAENDNDDPSLAAMAEYLTVARLKVETSRVASKSANAGEALLHETSTIPGALLVMGAYGHWGWREWVFGGVTRHVFGHATVPVLMAH